MPANSWFTKNVFAAFRKYSVWDTSLNGRPESAPQITAGAGAASASDPNGSLRLRTDGVIESRIGGAWKAVATADQTFDAGGTEFAAKYLKYKGALGEQWHAKEDKPYFNAMLKMKTSAMTRELVEQGDDAEPAFNYER